MRLQETIATAVMLDGTTYRITEKEQKALTAAPMMNNLPFLQLQSGVMINRSLVVSIGG